MKFIHANFLITYYYFIINVVTDRRMDIRAVLLVDRCDDASWSDVCARSERWTETWGTVDVPRHGLRYPQTPVTRHIPPTSLVESRAGAVFVSVP